jgi:hypothetical protein
MRFLVPVNYTKMRFSVPVKLVKMRFLVPVNTNRRNLFKEIQNLKPIKNITFLIFF